MRHLCSGAHAGAAGSGDLAERDGSAADNQPEEEEASDGSLDDEELEEGLIFGPSDDDGPEEDDGTHLRAICT